MDVFFEQIVPIKKDSKVILLQSLMWLAGLILAAIIVFAFTLYLYTALPVGVALAFGVIYLCVRWSNNFNCEFEYIFTNGDLDIDKIIAKQKRERKITFNVEKTEQICRYDAAKTDLSRYKKVIHACSSGDNAVAMVVRHKTEGLCILIFTPEEKMLNKIKEFIPRSVIRESDLF